MFDLSSGRWMPEKKMIPKITILESELFFKSRFFFLQKILRILVEILRIFSVIYRRQNFINGGKFFRLVRKF